MKLPFFMHSIQAAKFFTWPFLASTSKIHPMGIIYKTLGATA
jgi:hypothetical protein